MLFSFLLLTNSLFNNQPINRYRAFVATQTTFQRTTELGSLTEADGKKLGQVIMSSSHVRSWMYMKSHQKKLKRSRTEGIKSFISYYTNMRELSRQHPFFEPMIISMLTNDEGFVKEKTRSIFSKGHGATVRDSMKEITRKLHVLTSKDGENIGDDFSRILNVAANEEGAVAAFFREYPALKEFAELHVFFRPMLAEISKSLSAKVNFSKLFEATRSSMFTVFDFLTDVYTIFFYFNTADLADDNKTLEVR